MQESIIQLVTDIKSHRFDDKGNLIVDLRKDDTLELRKDGLFFTREIHPWNVGDKLLDAVSNKKTFDNIKRDNEIRTQKKP